MSSTQKTPGGFLSRLFGRKPAGPERPLTEEEIRAWLTERLAARLEVPAAEIDPRDPFSTYGLDSQTAVGLSGELERWLGRSLPTTLVWDFPSIELVARHLAGGTDGAAPGPAADPELVPGQADERGPV
jgi:acyl carrier protein